MFQQTIVVGVPINTANTHPQEVGNTRTAYSWFLQRPPRERAKNSGSNCRSTAYYTPCRQLDMGVCFVEFVTSFWVSQPPKGTMKNVTVTGLATLVASLAVFKGDGVHVSKTLRGAERKVCLL